MRRRTALSVLAVTAATACGGALAPDLDALNQELSRRSYTQAMTERSHFAPLCDEHGYPLVGNILSKGGTTASLFCEATRTQTER
jgi:hypothetical protein